MREVISVHVGQAGVQIGNACCMSFFPSFLCLYFRGYHHGMENAQKTRRFHCSGIYFKVA